jgi:hypothetical protein
MHTKNKLTQHKLTGTDKLLVLSQPRLFFAIGTKKIPPKVTKQNKFAYIHEGMQKSAYDFIFVEDLTQINLETPGM